MFKKGRLPIFILLIMLFSSGCDLLPRKNKKGCLPPPANFEVSDLYGTWSSSIDSYSDTIIIREDGTYQQHIWIAEPYYEFESEWLPWWLEYKDEVYYLHLTGMRMCVYWLGMDCDQLGSGDAYWMNYCRDDEWMQTPGEGVLILLGTPDQFEQPPLGFNLVGLQKSTIGVTVYRFQEP
jgi:hypothetical protein